jgi:hypothetical protein
MDSTKINQIIQKRREEATQKKISIKARSIVKHIGKPIIDQGEYTHAEWELMTQEIFESDESSRQMGWLFQAYPYGKEFEIMYLSDAETLTVTWFSDKVYVESDGIATTFVPGDEWEAFMEKMYAIAAKAEIRYLETQKQEEGKEVQGWVKRTVEFLQKNWGL